MVAIIRTNRSQVDSVIYREDDALQEKYSAGKSLGNRNLIIYFANVLHGFMAFNSSKCLT